MTKTSAHPWTFRARFRRHAFGWRSQPAITRIKEAVSELREAARRDPRLAAEGAVLFLERVSPAIEHVDSSSGAIGEAVNRAVAALAEIIAAAPVDQDTRWRWLERLWVAYEEDGIPYLESLGHHWGELCASPEIASRWADQLIGRCRAAWDPDPKLQGYFKGSTNCLGALLAAGRHQELLALLEMAPYKMWSYRRYGVAALAAMGRSDQAIRCAESDVYGEYDEDPVAIARACEAVLLAAGRVDEAFERYGLVANRAGTYLAWFRAVAKKYPHKDQGEVLGELVVHTPGEEGKWFAAAVSAKLFNVAIDLANRTPCSPQTLTRAARDFAAKDPAFALAAGMTALRWLVEGYGYGIGGAQIVAAYSHTMKAAEHAGVVDETRAKIRALVSSETFGDRLVTRVLGRFLALR